jgi:hypothetical protein
MAEDFIEMKGQPRRELERELALNYNLEQVVADLVDNSIDAGAENIEIIYNEEVYDNRKSFYVIVVDDGKGIPGDKISSVMNFGAPREYDELELGKFGVGMKSSSLSQAKEVTLLSKVANGEINLRRLSSEIVIEQDRWTLIPTLRNHMNTDAISIAKSKLEGRTSGSVVVLEDMHKLKYRVGNEGNRIAYLQSEYGHIKDYLSLVFERYIEGTNLKRSGGSAVRRKINLFFNGDSESNRLEKLDPFCRNLKDGSVTGTLSRELELSVDDGSKIHTIPVTIWITPNDKDRGTDYDKRMDRAARFAGISELQGMYIYRNERLIDFPGWKKILKHDPHMTCLRWEVHFPPQLDHVFQLDPSKREIQLPRQLFDAMTKISRNSYMWHSDDTKSVNHRARARARQGGKDKRNAPANTRGIRPSLPVVTNRQGSSSGGQAPQATGTSAPSRNTAPPPPQALKGVKINKLAGSITGQLFISERQEGDKLSVTLNTKHALYKSFIEEIKKQ